ncbi:MAG: phage tail protein [Oscillospiraceae bacterium]|jgi:phage tail protein X|nr:phage tail protein [Oscillospiraceae bacterium]
MAGTYTTIQGDMWDGIAHTQLGSAFYKDSLMTANRKYLRYYIFPAGITLTLPDEGEESSADLPPWRQVNG